MLDYIYDGLRLNLFLNGRNLDKNYYRETEMNDALSRK